ncbi:MAG: AlpA family phage regulatory protein [Polaromonas sp.]
MPAIATSPDVQAETLLRLPAVLQRFPVSRSKFLQGVKDGIYPKPVTITPRCVAWKSSSITALINSL